VVPDYLGKWSGRVLVKSCTETGAWADIKFCQEVPVGASDVFGLSVSRSDRVARRSMDCRRRRPDARWQRASSRALRQPSASIYHSPRGTPA
jgi:hypothetical protein